MFDYISYFRIPENLADLLLLVQRTSYIFYCILTRRDLNNICQAAAEGNS